MEIGTTNCRPAGCHMVGPVMLELGHDHADDDHASEHDERPATGAMGLRRTCLMTNIPGMVLIRNTTPVTPVWVSRAMVPPVSPGALRRGK